MAQASGHRLKWSSPTKMYWLSLAVFGRGPKKSKATVSQNDRLLSIRAIRGIRGAALALWQRSHPLMNVLTVSIVFGE